MWDLRKLWKQVNHDDHNIISFKRSISTVGFTRTLFISVVVIVDVEFLYFILFLGCHFLNLIVVLILWFSKLGYLTLNNKPKISKHCDCLFPENILFSTFSKNNYQHYIYFAIISDYCRISSELLKFLVYSLNA